MTDNGQLTTDSLALIERAQAGVVPADLEVCTALLEACDRIEGAARLVRWMAIAKAKECPELAESAAGRESPWIAWVMEHYADYTSKSHVHHMAQIGGLLLRVTSVLRVTLSGLCFHRLLSVSRLPGHLLPPFLEGEDVAAMNRDQVRDAVNRWLVSDGKPPVELEAGGGKDPKPPKHQADFLDVLFGDVECPEGEELYHQVEERLHRVDLPGTAATLTRSLCVANAALDRMAEEASAADLAPFAQNFEALLVHTRHAIATKTGITE
jgi:hypothetical protein